ncbi:hypothetical protein V8C44DRAFT_323012 [Trichoderma aethiopicum]
MPAEHVASRPRATRAAYAKHHRLIREKGRFGDDANPSSAETNSRSSVSPASFPLRGCSCKRCSRSSFCRSSEASIGVEHSSALVGSKYPYAAAEIERPSAPLARLLRGLKDRSLSFRRGSAAFKGREREERWASLSCSFSSWRCVRQVRCGSSRAAPFLPVFLPALTERGIGRAMVRVVCYRERAKHGKASNWSGVCPVARLYDSKGLYMSGCWAYFALPLLYFVGMLLRLVGGSRRGTQLLCSNRSALKADDGSICIGVLWLKQTRR